MTVKTVKKKQKHRGRGTVRTITKQVPSDSFFNFFSPLRGEPGRGRSRVSLGRLVAVLWGARRWGLPCPSQQEAPGKGRWGCSHMCTACRPPPQPSQHGVQFSLRTSAWSRRRLGVKVL